MPLPDSSFAVGVVARADGKGRAYGVFFGPRVKNEQAVDLQSLRPEAGALYCKFGDHGLYTGRWRIIGQVPLWSRREWRLPLFSRRHDNDAVRYVTEYDDDLNVRTERIVSAVEARGLPEDAQFGSAVVEAKLERLLK